MEVNLEMRGYKSLRLMTIFFLLFMIVNLGVSTAHAQETYELLWSYETGGSVRSVAISSDGSYIVVGTANKKVLLLDQDGKLLWSYQTTFPITDVSLSTFRSYNESYIMAGDSSGGYLIPNGWFYFLNMKGELLSKGEANAISSVSISPDGDYYALT